MNKDLFVKLPVRAEPVEACERIHKIAKIDALVSFDKLPTPPKLHRRKSLAEPRLRRLDSANGGK